MPVHWTEYPERVETFGDLISILETLDRHEMESGFTATSFRKERGRLTAYKVHSTPDGWRLHPDLDQMLGLERLLDRFGIDGYATLTQSQARELRRRAAKALNCDGAAVNSKTFTETADALDAAECSAKTTTPPRYHSDNPTSTPPTSVPSRQALDEASRLTLAALRAARTLPAHRERFSHPCCTPTLKERCEIVGEQVRAARAAVPPLALTFRAVTRYVADRPFCGKFWASAHEAAVEASNDLLWNCRPECGDPGALPEDRVLAALECEVEKEHAAAVARYCESQHEASRTTTPQQPTSVPTVGEIETFGDLLANVRSVEQAAASLRATADSMNGEPGTGYWRIQAAVYEADADYRKHPSFPHLEAHVNRHYGPFTYAHLLRVRGEVCAARHCGTADADQLPVEQVVAVLGCPGAPVADLPRGVTPPRQVNTRPASVEPPRHYVDAAMRALPAALNNAPQPQVVRDPAGRRGADYAILRKCLEGASHNRDAVEWAIHRQIEAGRLEACPGMTRTPGILNGGGWGMKPVTNHTYDRERCALWAQTALWDWWQENEKYSPTRTATPTAHDKSATQRFPASNGKIVAPFNASRSAGEDGPVSNELPSPFTVPEPEWHFVDTPIPGRDGERLVWTIGELLRQLSLFAKYYAEVSAWARDPDMHTSRQGAVARDANVSSAREAFKAVTNFEQLRTQIRLRFDAEVTLLSVNRLIGDLLRAVSGALTVAEVEQLEIGEALGLLNSSAVGSVEGKGGRPRIGERKDDRKDALKKNVYDRIKSEKMPGAGPQALLAALKQDRQFQELVREAGLKLDKKLVRAALRQGKK